VSETELDARNLLCPLPVIRTQDRVAQLAAGEVLSVHCNDPGARVDIPTWCRINGHAVLGIEQQGRELIIRIQVGTDR